MPGFNPIAIFRTTKEIAALARKAGGMTALERPMFMTIYHDAVVQRLLAIYQNRSSDENRFITISLTGENSAYVQALLPKNTEMVLCEAESGFYRDGSCPLTLSPEAVAALKKHGYSTDASAGNFQSEMGPIMDKDHLHGVAHSLLAVLYDVYGARLHSKVEFEAPLAEDE